MTLLTPPPTEKHDPMLDELLWADEIPDKQGFNILLHGQPGSGKTHLLGTAQKSEHGRNLLIVDVDGGARTVANGKDIRIFRPRQWVDLQRIYDWLIRNHATHGFRTVGLDSVTDIYRIALQNAMDANPRPNPLGVPSQSDYGAANETTIRMVRAFKEFSVEFGWNVIITAHTREDKDEASGAILTRPALTPGATLGIVGAVDAVGYIRRKPRSEERELIFGGTDGITAKYRQPADLPPELKMPERISNPTMHRILAHLRGSELMSPAVVAELPTPEGA